MARGALALHEATGDDTYLFRARGWTAVTDTHFWDKPDGGYFISADASFRSRLAALVLALVPGEAEQAAHQLSHLMGFETVGVSFAMPPFFAYKLKARDVRIGPSIAIISIRPLMI